VGDPKKCSFSSSELKENEHEIVVGVGEGALQLERSVTGHCRLRNQLSSQKKDSKRGLLEHDSSSPRT